MSGEKRKTNVPAPAHACVYAQKKKREIEKTPHKHVHTFELNLLKR